MAKNSKRPRDPNQLAKLITDIAVGEAQDAGPPVKDLAAVALGKKGGKARAESLTQEQRIEIAKKAASKRWTTGG